MRQIEAAIAKGDFSRVDEYAPIPFEGRFVSAEGLRRYITKLGEIHRGASPNVAMPRPSFGRGGVLPPKRPFRY